MKSCRFWELMPLFLPCFSCLECFHLPSALLNTWTNPENLLVGVGAPQGCDLSNGPGTKQKAQGPPRRTPEEPDRNGSNFCYLHSPHSRIRCRSLQLRELESSVACCAICGRSIRSDALC